MQQRDQEMAAVLGGLAGALPAAHNYLTGMERDLRDLRRTSRSAQSTSTQVGGVVAKLLGRGDLLRALYPTVQDLNAGLASTSYKKTAGGVLVPHEPTCARPAPPDEEDAADLQWPPKTSDYDNQMMMVGSCGPGQLYDLGRVLPFQEVQAFVTGLAQKDEPTKAEQVQVFRLARALTRVARARGYTPEQYEAAIEAVLPKAAPVSASGAVAAPSRLIDIVQADSTSISNTTAETAFDKALTIPGGTLPVGRSLRIRFGVRVPTTNSTDTLTLKIRLGSASGTTLVASAAVDVADGDTGWLELVITRRPDVGGAVQVVVQGMSFLKTTTAQYFLATSIDFTASQTFVATATWSAASTSDIAILYSGQAILE